MNHICRYLFIIASLLAVSCKKETLDKINVAEINKNKLKDESTQINLSSTFENKPNLILDGYYSPSTNQITLSTNILWPNGIEPEDHYLYRIETESIQNGVIFDNNNSTFLLPNNSEPKYITVTAKLIKSPFQTVEATTTGYFYIVPGNYSSLNSRGNFVSFNVPEIIPNSWVKFGEVYVPSGIVKNNESLYLYGLIYESFSDGNPPKAKYLGKASIHAGGFSPDIQFAYHDYIPSNARILCFVSKQNFPESYFTTIVPDLNVTMPALYYEPGFYWTTLKGMKDAVQPDITIPNRLRTEVDCMNVTVQNNVLYFQSLNLFPGGVIEP